MRLFSCVVALAGLAPLAAPGAARACGGCFNPPTGNPAPVDGHRMAITISPTETTLWDQISYQGDPEDFVWVLPIAGTSRVELAQNGFFEALTQATTITMVAPPPPRTSCADPCGGSVFGFASAASPSREFSEDRDTVIVHHEGVVGPYETATIGSEDPAALVTWLRENGYQVPDAITPTIDHYVSRGMNFAVLRLRPSTNVQRMQPVRVSVSGLATTFPLRMVAAGVESTVDLELFVFAESRIEAANFGNAEVDRAALTYDWASATFDYEQRFEDALFAGEGIGTNWVTEYAGLAPRSIGTYVGYDPETGMSSEPPTEDWAVVSRALAVPYLTRLRTRLPVSELGVDLELTMSDGGDLTETRILVGERNRPDGPDCPTYCATPAGFSPGGSSSRGRGSRFRCGVSSEARGAGVVLLSLGLAGLVLARRRA